MDPITDDEIKRVRIMKQHQQYEAYLNQIDEMNEKNTVMPTGEMQGKKVKQIESGNSLVGNLFHSILKKE